MKIDMNSDMGESFGAYKLGMDEEVIKYITSANIACGWHAGDPAVMRKTIQIAKENGVGIGAHPGFPDLLGFGRRNIDCTQEDIRDYVVYQIGALQAFAKAQGAQVEHVKPHGNLYLMAVDDEKIATAIAEAIVSVDKDLIYIALGGAKGEMMRAIGKKVGLRVAYEAFPDRAYTPEGTLVSRRQPGAVIKDEELVAQRALLMTKGKVLAIDGREIPLEVHTLCVHGDTPGAVNLTRRIRENLTAEGVELVPIAKML
ncbi:MAG: 5-oxoprolinase subunit PxpA [Thermodesulfobacteriota bacterium]